MTDATGRASERPAIDMDHTTRVPTSEDSDARRLLASPQIAQHFPGSTPSIQQISDLLAQHGHVGLHRRTSRSGVEVFWCILTTGPAVDAPTWVGRGPSAYAAVLDCLVLMLELVAEEAADGLRSVEAFLAEHSV